MGFFDGTKVLLKLAASIKLTPDGVLVNLTVDGDPKVVEVVRQLLPERDYTMGMSLDEILAAAMAGNSDSPMDSPSFEDAMAAAMRGNSQRGRGATVVDLSSFMAEAMAGQKAEDFPAFEEVFAAYMVDDYESNSRLVNEGAMAIALVQGDELPEDLVPPAVMRIATRYQQGVRDCHCGNPSCRAHFLFKVIEAFEAQYAEDETDGQDMDDDGLPPEDELDAQNAVNNQDGYRA